MKQNWLMTLVFILIGSIPLLQMGCQPQETVGEPKSLTLEAAAEQVATPEKAKTIQSEPNESAPKITFEQTVHDFGEVDPQSNNVCNFKFTNTGNSLLKITQKPKAPCACTVPKLSKTEYAPGESGTVEAKYNSGSAGGETKKYIYVYSNDPKNPEVKLTIKARIIPKVVYEPKKLQLLLKDENAGCPEITINSIDNQPFAITGFMSTNNCISADFDPAVKATKFVLQPKIDIEKLKQRLSGYLTIRLTHPKCKKVFIAFNALPRFTISPAVITILNAEPQKPITREVFVLNNYSEDFGIASTSSKNGFMKVLSQEKVDGQRYKFVLQITPPPSEGKINRFTDVFFANTTDGDKLSIVCRGFFKRKHPQSNQ